MYQGHTIRPQQPNTIDQQSILQSTLQPTHMFSSFEQINQSRSAFWNRVYQLTPNTKYSLFPQNKHQNTEAPSTPVGKAWGKWNPEKEPSFEFDIFKMLKEGKETSGGTYIQIQQPVPPIIQPTPPADDIVLFQPKRPPPFMGAFSHVQPSSFFPLNISVPSPQEYRPFSCFYHEQAVEEGVGHLEVSKISAIKDIKPHQNIKYFFEIDSAESEISEIADHPQSKTIHDTTNQKVEEGEASLLWNYAVLFEQRSSFKHRDPIWQDVSAEKGERQSRIFEISREDSLKTLHVMECELNLAEQMQEVLSDQYVMSEVSKMMQNVECELFTLDYASMQWSVDLGKWRLEHTFKNSLRPRLRDLISMASQRSRIDVALQYIRKRPFRRVYYQLGLQVTEILIIFEEIVLLVEFFLRVQRLRGEVGLVYRLLINEGYVMEEGRSYEDFDYRFLNSEYVIFKEVAKQARTADSLQTDTTSLIGTLLVAVFKPITSILSTLLFEESNTIELNDQVYLKYYFESHKDLLNLVSRKIALIKEESQELYQVCHMSDRIEILGGLRELQEYQHRWERTFARKRKLIERIRKNYRLRLRSEREKRHQERMRFIYSLKSRIYQQQQQENTRKRTTAAANREELQRLKREIQTRQERRKLLEMLEKEKERGLMLDIELQEKQKLQKEKDMLFQQIGQVSEQLSKKEEINKKENRSESLIELPPAIQQGESLAGEAIFFQQESSIKKQNTKKAQKVGVTKRESKEQIKPSETVSQQHIPSTNSIQGKMILTADNFLRRDRHSSKISNHTQSYFRLQPQPSFEIEFPPSDSSMEIEQPSSDEEDFQPLSVQLGIDRPLDLTTSLQICLGEVVRKQVAVVQSSLRFLVVEKYQVLQVMEFLRLVFLSGNGQRVQEFMLVAIDDHSMLNLKFFSECLLVDTPIELINRLEPAFYHTKNENRYDMEISVFNENVQNFIGFEFRQLPVILEAYFSYIHLSKYMQIFGFVLRLKYCQHLVTKAWKLLNNFNKELERRQREGQDVKAALGLLGRLYKLRYIINNFLITYQNYLFLKIIEKEYKILRLSAGNLHQLEGNHLRMLDNIIRFAFIDNPNQNVSLKFRQNLRSIQEFYQIVYQLTLDDIPEYRWGDTQNVLHQIYKNFSKQQKYIENLILRLT